MRLKLVRSGLVLRTGASLSLKLANVGLTFAVAVLLARLLGAESYGQYAFVYSVVMLLALPVQMGLPSLVTRETAKAVVNQDWPLVRGVWLWSFRCALTVSAVVLIVVMAWATLWAPKSEWRALMLIGWLLVPLLALGNIRGGALQGLGRVFLAQLPEFVLRPLFLALLVAAVAGLTTWTLSPEMALGLHVAAAMAAFAIGTIMLLRVAPQGIRQRSQRFEGRAWAMSALPLGLISGLHVLNSNIDIVMLGVLRSDQEVGVYKIVVSAAALVSLGLFSVNALIMPRIATAYVTGKRDELQRLITASARLAVAFAVPAAIVFILAGGWLLEAAFGAEYRSGYPALVILALGQIFNSASGSVTGLLNMTGHEKDTLAGVGLGAAVNIVLNGALIPFYGTIGAATASTLALLAWNAMLCWRVWSRLRMNSTAIRIGAAGARP